VDEKKPVQRRVYSRYCAYLLRLWQESADAPWRFLLESVATGERRIFSSLEGLFTFLERKTYRDCETDDEPEDGQ